MRCPASNHDNREAAKFCEECAAPITSLCASCGPKQVHGRPGFTHTHRVVAESVCHSR
jgi:hypothetical protein